MLLKSIRKMTVISVLITCALPEINLAYASDWSDPVTVMRRRQGMVVEYRAKIDSGHLVIEAKHGKGWHTYSMDNPQRASKKTGKAKADTELPTRIEIEGAVEVTGAWHQTQPKDLSMTDIGWYTWGFENTSYFSAPIKKMDGDNVTLTINAQACNENSCSMVEGQSITLPVSKIDPPAEKPPIPKPYVKVGDPAVLDKL